jgi:hypothetical protein
MKQILQKLIDSFDTTTKGFSSRKLTAFIIVSCVIAAHVKWLSIGDLTQLGEVFIIDYTFIAALFGMTTYSGIKSRKEDTTNSEIPNN